MSEIPAGSRYVAMGSSFGAGPGIAPRAPGSGVADRAPDCRILFVDYLTILPPVASGGRAARPAAPARRRRLPPAAIADWGRVIAARLAATTQEAADAGGAGYVPASAASAGHHAWSAAPWTRRSHLSLRGGAPYHPNAEGMAAVARLVLAALAGNQEAA